jgi:hypothetical protein
VLRSLLAIALIGVAACDPPCKRTCRKVLDCGNLSTDRLALDACIADCSQQELLYEEWEDERKEELFTEHKRCLLDATCEEIEAGECYVGYEELFPFAPNPDPAVLESSELERAE